MIINTVKTELKNFSDVLISYTKLVMGVMTLATIICLFYSLIKANYITVEIFSLAISIIGGGLIFFIVLQF